MVRNSDRHTLPLLTNTGRLVRIAPNTLLTDDPDLIRRMNAVRSPYRKSTVCSVLEPKPPDLTRSQWYEMTDFAPDRHHIFSETNEERHAQLRNQMAQGVSSLSL